MDIFHLNPAQTTYYLRLNDMMCWAVPCFFMITGALLLDKEKQITIKVCLCKYIRRILLALFLFGTTFALIRTYFETKTLSLHSIFDALLAVLQNKSWDHLWYLYTLIGVYFLLPILKRFTDNCTKNELLYSCILLIFCDCIIPVINEMCGIDIALTVWLPLRPCFYVLAGHYLTECLSKIKPLISLTIAILFLAGIWALYSCKQSDLYAAIKTCLVVSSSIFMFIAFKNLQIDFSTQTKTMLWRIDRLCFGVYLVHPIFIHLMYRFFHISPVNFGDSIIAVLLFFICFSVVSFMASWVMSLIKPLRKYIL